jgi:hypothetical protein
MADKKLQIEAQHITEWLYSVGYLLPSTDTELARFEALYPSEKIKVDASCIDPFAIINGTRLRKELSIAKSVTNDAEQHDFRMAARRYTDLPPNIIDRINKNQQSDDNADRSDNS